ncbi:hypothetical protein N7G274_003281 [Stereocaulon virgatum]|uniref:Ankyrin n=1 Tax=Stereocaulon virgatum TaxID=373712 RepID=A0ABR4AD66_9LECA
MGHDLVTLQRLFAERLWRPNDFLGADDSILFAAMRMQVTQVVVWLFQMGADLRFQVDVLGEDVVTASLRDMVTCAVAGGIRRPLMPWMEQLPMIEYDEYLAKAGFGKLHKIVCNVNDRDLEREILARPEDVNKLDEAFKSPLYYAVILGDTAKVRILLKHGAEPNASIVSILSAAFKGGTFKIIESLLEAGAWILALNKTHIRDEAHHAYLDKLAHSWWWGPIWAWLLTEGRWRQPGSTQSYDVDGLPAIDRTLITHGISHSPSKKLSKTRFKSSPHAIIN